MSVVARWRQAGGIRRALDEARSFGRAPDEGIPAEMAAPRLRPAETALSG